MNEKLEKFYTNQVTNLLKYYINNCKAEDSEINESISRILKNAKQNLKLKKI